jgi:hypothetical protein
MIIDKMASYLGFDTDNLTPHALDEIEIKLMSIEERIVMQIKNVIMEYASGQIAVEDAKKKPKPYYRRGRWE